jgi:AcrR family transcriptional regulator
MARPKDPRRGNAILDAVRELLHEVGFDGLTIEQVAERAGVGRPTVYRRWSSKAELVVAAFQSDVTSPRSAPAGDAARAPDTGTLRGDVRALIERLVEGFTAMERHGAMGGIAAEMATNVAFADDLRQRWLDPDEQALAVVFERAEARGEVRQGVDGASVLSVVAGAVFYRIVLLHQTCPSDWQDLLVDLTLEGVGNRS